MSKKHLLLFSVSFSTNADYTRTSNIQVGIKKIENPPLPVYPGTEQKWCVITIE